MSTGVLVIGYGNVLRSDDGVGWHVTERLASDARFAGVTVLQRHQLTPELALDLSQAERVALVDACADRPAGVITVEHPDPGAGGVPTWSHRMEPADLATLARSLYGRAPAMCLVSVGAESFDVGEGLSPAVAAAVPRVVDALADLAAAETWPGREA